MKIVRMILLAGLVLYSLTASAAGPPVTVPNVISHELNAFVDAILSGGPGKDGIPAIDRPQYWDVERADRFLDNGDIVFGIHLNGAARAYPQRILVWHEIVNDTIGGEAISVTYCPLTGTALGFHRDNSGFGVSGRLVNSNMVMYDRGTDSYWPQILAAAIRGPLRGKGLRESRVFWTTWGRWKARYPDTSVLSSRTGYMRDYRSDPYGQYNSVRGYYKAGSSPLFPVMNEDNRFPAKKVILGFRTSDAAVAVDKDYLRSNGLARFRHNRMHYLVIHDPGLDTGWVYRSKDRISLDASDVSFGPAGPRSEVLNDLSPINAFEAMWFAWSAFYPETRVLDGSSK